MRRPIALALAWAVASCSVLPLPKPAAADFNQALAPVFELDMPSALARLATLPESALTTQHRAVRGDRCRCVGSLVGIDSENLHHDLLSASTDEGNRGGQS